VCFRKGAIYTFLENFKKSLFRGSVQKCAEKCPSQKNPRIEIFLKGGGGHSGCNAKEPYKCLRKRQNEGVKPMLLGIARMWLFHPCFLGIARIDLFLQNIELLAELTEGMNKSEWKL